MDTRKNNKAAEPSHIHPQPFISISLSFSSGSHTRWARSSRRRQPQESVNLCLLTLTSGTQIAGVQEKTPPHGRLAICLPTAESSKPLSQKLPFMLSMHVPVMSVMPAPPPPDFVLSPRTDARMEPEGLRTDARDAGVRHAIPSGN
ncbi:hypothetical protein CDEST_09056 [Colletotrichum destructivum]|uniref:Uncharacterized protein n=1 Tax=Colletotrichum destructivum TaxID=34406 RepID=A0AAX4IL04_9PEZI|nr:hypothetical protein CDEST_09056 [Colletotrichum destructivum]